MQFAKFHGFGNDYLIFVHTDLQNIKSPGDFARRVCNRHYGVGADGIAVVQQTNNTLSDFSVRIFNPDGSEAGFSGNGTRCAVAFLHYKGSWSERNLRLATKSGVKNYRLLETIADGHYRFEAALGKPRFDLPKSELLNAMSAGDDRELDKTGLSLLVEDKVIGFFFVNVGNPVCCIFLEDFDQLDWRHYGREIEIAPLFPERANVVFIKILDRQNLEVRIWERGAGETMASGTCSIAAAVASSVRGATDRRITVHSPGGQADVYWREKDDEILLAGRADFVFAGEWLEES